MHETWIKKTVLNYSRPGNPWENDIEYLIGENLQLLRQFQIYVLPDILT